MYKARVAVLTTAIAAISSGCGAEDLLAAAGTVTDTKSFVSEISANWVSVFYQGNMDLQSLAFMRNSAGYDSATSLYGTTELPASYPSAWAAGYLSRAQETAGESNDNSSENDSNSSDSESEESSSDDQDTSDARSIHTVKAATFGVAIILATFTTYM
ncbi:hypothetical protein H4R24_004333 [Coemansia sp. RSA 988]|nr:hypothetical protein H4R24_004333 [Coemansia sp. RSA 988]